MKNLEIPYPKLIFVFGHNQSLGKKVVKKLKTITGKFKIKYFSNGEQIPHQDETVRGRDVYIIFTGLDYKHTSFYLDYLVFVRSIKNGQPYRITVILPKLIWQRQDVENREEREPKLSDFFPELLKTAGMNCMVVLRLHNPASCTTDPPMENIGTTKLIVDHIKSKFPDLSNVSIGATDMGGSKYSRKIAEILGVPLVIVDKERDKITGKTKSINVYTERGFAENEKIDTVIFVDDLINSFGSAKDAGNALFDKYPKIKNYVVAVTHPDFSPETLENIMTSRFSKIMLTDTVPTNKYFLGKLRKAGIEVEIISVFVPIAQVIDNLHNGESVSEVWKVIK